MKVTIVSLFPEYFDSPLSVSILKRAQEKGLLSIAQVDLKAFGEGKWKRVDDRPYGGGPGMVLMPGPMAQAIRSCRTEGSRVIYLTPQGKKLSAGMCERLARERHLVLVCGHYEGLDERVVEAEVDEEISIGDYVLTSGCVAALALLDAVVRFIPGVLGNDAGAWQDSFQGGRLEAPQYTRPPVFEGRGVPQVLLSGNHEEIAAWREDEARAATERKRPDLRNYETIETHSRD